MANEWIEQKLLIRDLMQSLKEHPQVHSVENKHHWLRIKFTSGLTEHWAITKEGLKKKTQQLFKLPFNKSLFTDHSIPTFRQFETNPLYPEEMEILKDHFLIKKKDLDKAGWCDRRFFAHELTARLADEGYVPIQYTDKILWADLEALRNENLDRYQDAPQRFSSFSKIPPSGRRLILHFMETHAKEQWNLYQLYLTINDSLHRNISREDIVYYTGRRRRKDIVRHPAFYRAFFKQWLDIRDKAVYDLCPDIGYKALAAGVFVAYVDPDDEARKEER